MERVRTNELKGSSRSARQLLERSKVCQVLLKILGVLGVSLVMSGRKASYMLVMPCSVLTFLQMVF